MSERVLPVVVIYENPLDFPGRFVVRRQWACKGDKVEIEVDPLAVVDTLEQARAAVPMEQDARVDRDPDDDSKIVECWV